MSSARSRWGSTDLASKQLAGEWKTFKRQGDEEILIQLWVFPHGGLIFTTSFLSLSNALIQSQAAVGKRMRLKVGRNKEGNMTVCEVVLVRRKDKVMGARKQRWQWEIKLKLKQ